MVDIINYEATTIEKHMLNAMKIDIQVLHCTISINTGSIYNLEDLSETGYFKLGKVVNLPG